VVRIVAAASASTIIYLARVRDGPAGKLKSQSASRSGLAGGRRRVLGVISVAGANAPRKVYRAERAHLELCGIRSGATKGPRAREATGEQYRGEVIGRRESPRFPRRHRRASSGPALLSKKVADAGDPNRGSSLCIGGRAFATQVCKREFRGPTLRLYRTTTTWIGNRDRRER